MLGACHRSLASLVDGRLKMDLCNSGVASIWLSNPQKANMLSSSLIHDLTALFDHIERDTSVRAVVIRHEGEW